MPLKRPGVLDDVVRAAAFLAGDRAARNTGVVLPIDGGISTGDPVNHVAKLLAAQARAGGGGMMAGLTVTFVEEDGTVRTIEDARPGQSLMEAGRDHDVVGILADCGGACACATCHVYIDEDWRERVGPRDEIEAEMLDMVSGVQKPESRLSCRIRLGELLDGLRVTVAPRA